jgi:hypothetical protein
VGVNPYRVERFSDGMWYVVGGTIRGVEVVAAGPFQSYTGAEAWVAAR